MVSNAVDVGGVADGLFVYFLSAKISTKSYRYRSFSSFRATPGCLRMAGSSPDELLRYFSPYCRALKGYPYYT